MDHINHPIIFTLFEPNLKLKFASGIKMHETPLNISKGTKTDNISISSNDHLKFSQHSKVLHLKNIRIMMAKPLVYFVFFFFFNFFKLIPNIIIMSCGMWKENRISSCHTIWLNRIWKFPSCRSLLVAVAYFIFSILLGSPFLITFNKYLQDSQIT